MVGRVDKKRRTATNVFYSNIKYVFTLVPKFSYPLKSCCRDWLEINITFFRSFAITLAS